MAGDTIITVIGNLTADPELRFTGAGVPVASFTIASTPRSFNRQTSQWEDGEALFMRCSLWREPAENAADSLQKGMRVIAQGRLQQRSYETPQGEKRRVVEMQVDEIGPSLRYATANVNRAGRGGNYAGEQSQQQGSQERGNYGYQNNQNAGYKGNSANNYGGGQPVANPQNGAQPVDPWSTGGAQAGSSFDDEPPF